MLRYALALLLLCSSAAWAAPPKTPAQWVTDNVGLLSAPAAQTLNEQLKAYEAQSGHQLLVYIDRTTAGIPLEDFTISAFKAWKVGRASIDDGLVLFVFVDDKQARIEVGYGLEPLVTDASAARLLREVLIPQMQANDLDGAITKTVEGLISTIDGKNPERVKSATPTTFSLTEKVSGVVVALAFLLLLIFRPSWALMLLYMFLRRGGGGGDGGGFSGGGGRSGGGGASGRW